MRRAAGMALVTLCAGLGAVHLPAPASADHVRSCVALDGTVDSLGTTSSDFSYSYQPAATAGPDFTMTVSWGDGSSQTRHVVGGEPVVFGPKRYDEPGMYELRADAAGVTSGEPCHDDQVYLGIWRVVEGAAGSRSCLPVRFDSPRQAQVDQQASLRVALDPEAADDYTLTIDWGDGRGDVVRIAGSPRLFLAHTYTAPGSHTATYTAQGTRDGQPCENPGTELARFEVAAAPDSSRLSGTSRVETAVDISQRRYADGSAGAVVLARSDLYPDALAGAPLATAVRGPLLLTPSAQLHPATAQELGRTLARGGRVYLLGGEAALSSTVADTITGFGYEVVRLGGRERQETATLIAGAATASPAVIYLATGYDFPDGLVASAAGGARGGVLLLSAPHGLGTGQAYLDAHPDVPVIVVGEAARPFAPAGATVIAGGDPSDTSRLLASHVWPTTAGAALASAEQFPDGLTGGAHAAGLDLPLLLSPQAALPATVGEYLGGVAPLDRLYLYGGPVALSAEVEQAAAAAAGLR